MLGQAYGGFSVPTNYATGTLALSVATADFDQDGDLDLVVANYGNSNISVLLGNGDGTFEAPGQFDVSLGSGPHYVAIADFDGDGKLDLGLANYDTNNLSIMKGNGDGSFTPSGSYFSGGRPVIIVSDDWNGDQKIDLAVVNSSDNTVSIFLGNGDGTFSSRLVLAVGGNPYGMASSDLNQDGLRDLVVTNRGSTVTVLLGNGDGTFRPQQTYSAGSGATSIAVGDFDADGNQDLIVANFGTSSLSLLLGNGDGTLQPALSIAVAGPQRSVVAGDFNGDQRTDFATAVQSLDKVSILYNVTPAAPDLAVSSVTGENLFVLQNASLSSAAASVALSNVNTGSGTINGFSTSNPLLTATIGQTFSGAGAVTPGSVISLTSTAANTTALGATVTYTTAAADINSANNTATVNVNVGNATLVDPLSYGPKLTASTPINGTTYRNLASNTLDTSLHQGATLGTAVGTTATILSYENLTGSDTDVTMAWQARRTGPMTRWVGSPSSPSPTNVNLVSDTVIVEGLYNVPGSYRDTDPFVIQMSYSEALLNGLESSYIANRQLSLVSFNEYLYNSPEQYYGWGKTIEGNSSGTETYYQSSWADAGSPLTVGSWGVDPTNNTVWAVVDHAGEFGVAALTSSVTPPQRINVAAGKPVTVADGSFSGASLSTLTDGITFTRGSPWQTDTVWWTGLSPTIEIDLQKPVMISAATLQADDNDAYQMDYRDALTGEWKRFWDVPNYDARIGGGMISRPDFPATDSEHYFTVPIAVAADKIRVRAASGDNLYSLSEISVFTTVSLKLAALSDTGISNSDRITNDATPTFEVTVSQAGTLSIDLNGDGQADPVDFGYGNTTSFSVPSAGVYTFTTPSLSDGSHVISARFAPLSEPAATDTLAVVIDTLGPKIISAVPGGDAAGVLSHFIVNLSEELGSPIANVQLTGPNGTIPVTITALSALTYRVEFLPQATAGAYELFVYNTGIRDLANNGLDQNENGVAEEAADFFHNIYTVGNSTGNLLWNGDAEQGSVAGPIISGYTPYSFPGWKVLGSSLNSTAGMLAQLYDEGNSGNINPTTPGPVDRGLLYFVGGYAGTTVSRQQLWLGEYAPSIDSGLFKYDLTGWLGGFLNHPDNAQVTLAFLDSQGQPLVGSATLAPVTEQDRNNLSGMLYREALDLDVPVGARQAIVTIAMERVLGTFNNAAVDNLQLTLRQAPNELLLTPVSGAIAENLANGKVSITLARTGDSTQPLTVSLQSSDTTELTVPAAVTFDAGQDSLTFDASVIRDGLVDGTQTVTITALSNGLVPGTSTISVVDSDLPLLSISLDKSQVSEGGSVLATITRNSNLYTALTVSLAEANSPSAVAQFELPAVTIPANAASVTVVINTLDDTLIEGPTNVTLSATAAEYSVASTNVNVLDNDLPPEPAIEVSVLEDSGYYFENSSTFLPGSYYVYSTEVTYSITSGDPNLFASPPKLVSDYYQQWKLEFTPQANANGVALVHAIFKDLAGDTLGEYDFYLEVKPVNDAPSFQAGGNVTVLEDSGVYHQSWASTFTAGPPNESSQQLTWDVTAARPELFSVQPTIDREGKLHFTPAPNAYGTTQVTVLLMDNGGTAHGGSDSAYATFTITIEPVPEPGPTITSIQYFAGTTPVSNPLLTPITSIVVAFDRVMTADGPGGVRTVANWDLTKDGKSIEDQIGTLIIVSEQGQPTQLQINFKEPLGAGEYVLVAEPAITDHSALHLGQTAEATRGAAKSFSFSITLTINDDDDDDRDRGVDDTDNGGTGNPTVPTNFTPPQILSLIIPALFGLPNPLNRIQASSAAPAPLPLPQIPIIVSFNNGVIGATYLTVTPEQPEIAITGLGTSFITSTLPELTLDEEGDEFLTREEAKNRMLVILQPVPALPSQAEPQQAAVFPWWWVGLGMSSLLGGIGYYTVQRRLASRTKRIPLT